ncbi:MAG: PPC domain-containing protein [Planctomycetes bacterium]|nr:PPC domain-containing protein [Planctomycetota bacterium]
MDCLSFCPIGRCCQGGGACCVFTQDHCLDVGGTWTIGQTCLPESCIPPSNSTCATAHVVTCGSVVNGTNVGASDDYVFTAAGCSGFASLGPDVVYSIISPSSQPLTITMDPTDADLGLYVVTDCSNAQASCVVADDSGGSGTLESVVFNATAGVTYYILIETFNNSGNPGDDFVLQVECTSCPSCPGDMQIDEALNGSDIQGFVDCFLTPGPVCACADMDENGILNLIDVVEFVNAILSKNCSP